MKNSLLRLFYQHNTNNLFFGLGTTSFIIVLLSIISIYHLKANNYNEWRFFRLTTKNGLPHNNVDCILKCSDGFIWFGTRNGLCRYDGYEVVKISKINNPESPLNDRILCLKEDFEGNMWIGTFNSGLIKYNKATQSYKQYDAACSIGKRVNKIRILSDSSIWICSINGLAHYIPETDSFKIFIHDPLNPESINSNTVTDLLETHDYTLYVSTNEELIQRFDRTNNKFISIVYKRDANLPLNNNKQMVEDKNGIIWISALKHGLCSYNPVTGYSEIIREGKNKLSTNNLEGSISLDKYGNIWLSTDGGGINIFNPLSKSFNYIKRDEKNDYGLSSNTISKILFDDNGIIWIGTYDEGVNYYNPKQLKIKSSLYAADDLDFFKNKTIMCLFEDSKNRIWIGTDGSGLYMIDNNSTINEFHHIPGNDNSLPEDIITAIQEDENGNIMIATYSKGLYICKVTSDNKGEKSQLKLVKVDLTSENIWYIFRDDKDQIWLGLQSKGFRLYHTKNSEYHLNNQLKDIISDKYIITITEDNEGELWFGTRENGVYRMKSDFSIKPVALHKKNGKETLEFIRCFYPDNKNNIWIGTEFNGLFQYQTKSGTIQHYCSNVGFPSNIIRSIYGDSENNLWIGTSKGLVLFNTSEHTIRIFDEENGLNGNECKQKAFIKLHDGRFLIGSTKGLNIFNPNDMAPDTVLPRIVLMKLNVNNQNIDVNESNSYKILEYDINDTKQITLSPEFKSFTIFYSALSYTSPKKCKYAYKLEGYDTIWHLTDSDNRQASYSNLPNGTYCLKIKASNSDGIWGDNTRLLEIIIMPHFYQTFWFILLSTALFLSLLTYFIIQHKKTINKKKLEEEKNIMQIENDKMAKELKNLTFHIINHNRSIINQKQRLMGLSVKANKPVKTGLENIIVKLDEGLTDFNKNWKLIEPQLDKVYDKFVSRLRNAHPDLTIAEIKIAAYVRMDLTNKEISELVHKTLRAVETDRYRLRKKIGLDSNDSLKDYLLKV